MAVHPVAAPAHDARAANNAWAALRRDNGFVELPDGTKLPVQHEEAGYVVFAKGGYPALMRWIQGIGEFDGRGLADAVKTNANHLNVLDKAHHAFVGKTERKLSEFDVRLAALEQGGGGGGFVPFGASG